MNVTWGDSGKGAAGITLQLKDAQLLAIDAGFVFPGTEGFFESFGVNSFSSFKSKFAAYELHPSSAAPSGVHAPLQTRHEWVAQLGGEAGSGCAGQQYVGELVDGRRHGLGILLELSALAPRLYIGQWAEGQRNGLGAVLTPRGESFHGFFRDDAMWGPGLYTFPAPTLAAAVAAAAPERRLVRYEGMLNGRPQGRGVLTWSDGERVIGQWDGTKRVLELSEDECAGVVLVARQNAEAAKRAAAEAQVALARRGLWEGQGAELLAACSAPPRHGAAGGWLLV